MVTQAQRDMLPELMKKVEAWHTYFDKNNKRYNDFFNFVFNTSLTQSDINTLSAQQKPTIEFNVLEAFINQLMGEFANQTPSVNVRADDTMTPDMLTPKFIRMMQVIEGYLREIITSPRRDGLQNKFYKDLLGGGFSVAEVYTDYLNNETFEQDIFVKRAFDPTMCGFDPLAEASHKGDGQYCFQLYPRSREEFEAEYGKELAKKVPFTRGESNMFSWSYSNGKQEVVLLCDMFIKVKKRVKLVKLTNGHVIVKDHYKDLLEEWDRLGFIEQPPKIVKERAGHIEYIDRYQFCQSEVLDYKRTDYDMLPLIFIDGNSVCIRDDKNGVTGQMTRPYVYQAKGVQRLKNYAGQCVANELENQVQHKFKVAIESIPEDYLTAYENVQQADTLMYNAFYKGDPSIPLPPPVEIVRAPTPQIVETTFLGTDKVTEVILGSYNTTLATQEGYVSGKSVAMGSIHTSAASTPYLTGYINGLNRICEVVASLIPKYYVTPRTIPIRTYDGKRAYKVINANKKLTNQNPERIGEEEIEVVKTPGMAQVDIEKETTESIEINYRPNQLNIEVEAGVNNTIQKGQTLELITRMMSASETFAKFINTMGLPVLIENMDIRNVDSLMEKAEEFMKAQQEAERMEAEKPDPQEQAMQMMTEVEMAKVAQKEQQVEGELAVQTAKTAIEKQKADTQFMEAMASIESKNAQLMIDEERLDSENARTAVESAMNVAELIKSENNKEL